MWEKAASADRNNQGFNTLTPAEKQRRYRERLKAGHRPVITRKPRDRRSRAQRWRDALAELIALQEHWRRCLDALPDTLHDTPYGERLQAMAEADIETLEDLDPPLGYGRDT